MRLAIKEMEIENFKGIKKINIKFGDGETRIEGKNAVGKTSIADAFFWLLFNTDSHGNAPGSDKFHEKPLDEDGSERHHLDTSVSAKCFLDGKQFNLKRVQRENWPTKRGSKDAVYDGNSSTYWINDVETGAREYKERINGIANGDMFSLVAKLGAFNALDMKKKRDVLLSMSGINVDEAILAKEEYKQIAEEAAARGIQIDDLKKVLNDQKKRINQDMTLIPAKIDEVERMIPEYTDQEMKDAEYFLNETNERIEMCQRMIANEEAGNDSTTSIMNQYLNAEQELISIKRRITDEHSSKRKVLESEKQSAFMQLETARKTKDSAAKIAANALAQLGEYQKALENARNEYRAVYARVYKPSPRPEVCPTCGQAINDEHWAKTVKAEQEAFEAAKMKEISDVSAKGKDYKAKFEGATKASESAKKALDEAEAAVKDAEFSFSRTSDSLISFSPVPAYDVPEVKELEKKIEDLKKKKDTSPNEKIMQLKNQIDDLTKRNNQAKEKLAKRDRREECVKRINELADQLSDLGQKKADIENMIFNIEKFITERCRMLESSINEKFPTVRWKLFDRQINGAVVDCCECMVPSDNALMSYSGTNTAAKVNADIEIICVLSKYYDIVAPVFVDNAESVNYIAKPDGQLITLNVTLDDELKVEPKEAA